MAYMVSRGRFINFVAFEMRPHEEGTHFGGPWVVDVDPPYVASLFQGWEKDVDDLIQVRVQPLDEKTATPDAYDIFQCLGGLKITRWTVNVLPALPFFARGNVAILGDAVGICFFSATYRTPDHKRKKNARRTP